jgi:hypothetical protein
MQSLSLSRELSQVMVNTSFVLRIAGDVWSTLPGSTSSTHALLNVVRGNVTAFIASALDVPAEQVHLTEAHLGSLIVSFSLNQFRYLFKNASTVMNLLEFANYTALKTFVVDLTGRVVPDSEIYFMALAPLSPSPMQIQRDACDDVCVKAVVGCVVSGVVCTLLGFWISFYFTIWKDVRVCVPLCQRADTVAQSHHPVDTANRQRSAGDDDVVVGFVPDDTVAVPVPRWLQVSLQREQQQSAEPQGQRSISSIDKTQKDSLPEPRSSPQGVVSAPIVVVDEQSPPPPAPSLGLADRRSLRGLRLAPLAIHPYGTVDDDDLGFEVTDGDGDSPDDTFDSIDVVHVDDDEGS